MREILLTNVKTLYGSEIGKHIDRVYSSVKLSER